MPGETGRGRRRWRRWILVTYVALLVASHLVRAGPRPPGPRPHDQELVVDAVRGAALVEGEVRLVYRDVAPADPGTPVLLIHGSPGSLQDFDALGRLLARDRRVVVPDLPGFGRSSRRIPDYSFLAHARYLEQMLERLRIERVHVVGFSLGGGVALHLQEMAPERVASIAFVGSIGVQELELLGNYELNHLVHGAQLAGLWLATEAVPHFGLLDGGMLGAEYARNFYDSDQRPLRGMLERIELPFLVVHGRKDPLVPYAAAQEHARIVPHAQVRTFENRGHFLLWRETQGVAQALDAFFERVEGGQAPTRADASPERIARAAEPFAAAGPPPAQGIGLVVLVLLIVVATFVSEDLTCIATGMLVAHGRLPLPAGIAACFTGIFFGDLLLYGAGRGLGRAVARTAPWRWLVTEESLRRAAEWFERRGMMVIFLSRLLPGTRVPAYLAAGIVRANFVRFALYFFVAVALWTPLLVGFSAVVGQEAVAVFERTGRNTLPAFVLTIVLVWLLVRVAIPALDRTGRRLLLGRWRRLTRWEFWPWWLVYLPVLAWIGLLAIRHRSLRLVTAVNPGIPEGGFVGESKLDILLGLEAAGERVAQARRLPADASPAENRRRVRDFLSEEKLDFPVVLKPDAGERGTGVRIVRSLDEAESLLGSVTVDYLVQEHVPGPEWGIFWARDPRQPRGRIFSITEKRLPEVVGDGASTLEQLILADERAVCMAETHLATHADRLGWIPARGESVRLVELGTHCRGAVFRDGNGVETPQLEEAIERVSRGFSGFFFGRYDVRAPSAEALREGRFKILELNGMTSEATHIYDPRHSLLDAYRALFAQWRLAFEIAAANRAAGAPLAAWPAILARLRTRRRVSRW